MHMDYWSVCNLHDATAGDNSVKKYVYESLPAMLEKAV